jgi:hypothetical protein
VPPTPPSAELRALAPDFARRFGWIVAGLYALVGARFLKRPHLVAFTLPLANRLNRAVQRFQRLMALLAAGKLPRQARAREGSPEPDKSEPATREPTDPTPSPSAALSPSAARLPSRRGWLLRELTWEAAAYRGYLEQLLAEPAMAEVLAAAPSAGRILRPLCRLLGLPESLVPKPPSAEPRPVRKRHRRRPAAPARTAAAPTPAAEPARDEVWPWLVPRPRYAIP